MTWLIRASLAALALAAGIACDIHEHDPPLPEECKGDASLLARFDLDLGTWPVTGDTLVIDASCTVDAAGGGAVGLSCSDPASDVHAISLTLTATPAISTPLEVGQAVTFHLRRAAADPTQVGAWAIRSNAGDLVLGGNQSNATVPDDPAFFAPLHFTVDADTCPRLAEEETCYYTTHLLVTVDDGAGQAVVTHGTSADLAGGQRIVVERATRYDPGGDGKACQVDSSVPATYRFLIGAP